MAVSSQLRMWLQELTLTANKSYAGSLEYMITFSNVALSSVIYNKGIFPKKSYSIEHCDGQLIPMLKQKSDCSEANTFYSWVSGFQDAIDKKYLRTVVLTFFDAKQPGIPIEESKLTFTYNQGNVTFDSSEKTSTIREDTLNLLRASTAVAKGFGKFPKTYHMSMNLTYYKEVTPADYRPPGFSARGHDEEPKEVIGWKRILIGSVATPCHKVRMIVSEIPPPPPQSASRLGKDCKAESGGSAPIETLVPDTISNSATAKYLSDRPRTLEPPMIFDKCLEKLFAGDDLFHIEGDIPESTETTAENRKVAGRSMHGAGDVELDCPCGKRFFEDTIRCKSCKKFQHSACFGLLAPVDPPEHYCDKCGTEDPRLTCTDPEFTTVKSFSHKRKRSVGKADSSKNRQRLHKNL